MALDERREKYAQNRARGVGRAQSAVLAGFSGDKDNAAKVEEAPDVAARIAELKAKTAADVNVTREMVAAGLLDAAALAKLIGDVTGMVAAWRELGKLLGHYAPEVKKLEKGIGKKELRRALEDLGDEELQKLARGRIIDGNFKRIETDTPALPDLSKG